MRVKTRLSSVKIGEFKQAKHWDSGGRETDSYRALIIRLYLHINIIEAKLDTSGLNCKLTSLVLLVKQSLTLAFNQGLSSNLCSGFSVYEVN
jgi:hypothetical protein